MTIMITKLFKTFKDKPNIFLQNNEQDFSTVFLISYYFSFYYHLTTHLFY